MDQKAKGRDASRPAHIGAAGWKDILRRVRSETKRNHLDVVAAGVAFYSFLSLFPALGAGVSLYGLVSDPRSAVEELNSVLAAAPAAVRDIVASEAERLLSHRASSLGIGLITTLALALWSANRGTKALLAALDIAYHETNDRGFLKGNALSLALTVAAVISAGVLLGLLVAVPLLLGAIGLDTVGAQALKVARWPVLAVWLLFSLAVLYRFGPSRQQPKWRWVTPGSAMATLLLLVASAGFALYASRFGSFDRTYGSLGAVAVLLTWLYLSAYSVLLGAELNGEAEHQTRKDSTTGPSMPMGRRGAYAADTLGGSPA
jgi:membrane protein